MNWLHGLTTARKVILGLAGGIALALLIGGVGVATVHHLDARLGAVVDEQLPAANALGVMNEALATVSRAQNALLLPKLPPDLYQSATQRLVKALERMEKARQRFEALPHDPATAKAWAAVQQPYESWRVQARGVADAALAWDRARSTNGAEAALAYDRAWEAWMAARHAYAPLELALTNTANALATEAASAREQGRAASRRAMVVILAALLAAVAISIVAGAFLTRAIARSIARLLAETGNLARAVQAGALGVRGEAEGVSREFRPVVDGMNATMDAFVAPIRVTAEHLAQIARGEIPPRITADYRGDFNEIKNSLNTCVDAVNALVADAGALASAAVEGKLSTRADDTRHQGDFRKIVSGVNGALDAVLEPIAEAGQALDKLARRDLRARMEGAYRGDHATMKDALNATAAALLESMSRVAESVSQVSSAAAQIASSSQAVADGASRQASSLEETSSSLESMSSMTKQAADNAQQANGLAQTARRAASEGSEAMERMTGAMSNIRASAEGTSQIIKDINEIAFQTNLLALNAAVEAARAGEAGRGFAVVAEEVRSLALRSKEAANRTEALIRESVKQAGEGEVTASHVHAKLAEIAGSVAKVSDIVSEMAAAAKEQAAGIDQITKAVSEIDKVTQQNAANSEESSSAASELSGASERLAEMVGTFQLGVVAAREGPRTAAPARPSRHPRGANGVAAPVN